MSTFSSINLIKLAVHLADCRSLPSGSMSKLPLAGNGRLACIAYTDTGRTEASERDRDREQRGRRANGKGVQAHLECTPAGLSHLFSTVAERTEPPPDREGTLSGGLPSSIF